MTCPVAVRMAAFPWRAPRDGAGAVPGATTARGVTVRPLGRAEAPAAVDAVFAGLSPRSRFLRFHSPVPRLAPGVRERLTDLDGHARVALVAETGGVAVGIARLAGDGREAEAALAVVDAWQRRGIGRRLLRALTDLATDLGYRELTGHVLPENAGMLALAGQVVPWTRRTFDGDAVRLVLPLGPAATTLTHEDLLADLLAR